jgi:hypothetical protein
MSHVWFFRAVTLCRVYIMSCFSFFRWVTWCRVLESFIPLHDVTCLFDSFVTCLILSSSYLMSYVCFSSSYMMPCVYFFHPVTWCHVFASFVQLHYVTCLLLLLGYMTSRVCFFRPVTLCRVFASSIGLHDVTCLLLLFSCMISDICLFCPVTWNYTFPSLPGFCFAHSWRYKSSVRVVIRHGLEDRGIVVWLLAGVTVFSSPWHLNPLWCPTSLLANRKCGLITWAKTAGTWTLAFTSN